MTLLLFFVFNPFKSFLLHFYNISHVIFRDINFLLLIVMHKLGNCLSNAIYLFLNVNQVANKTLIFLLKFLWVLLLLYLSILSFFSSGLYRHALLILSMMILFSLDNGLSDRWPCCTILILCNHIINNQNSN